MAGVTDRDVERARTAYGRVDAGKRINNMDETKYKSGLRQLPSMLQMHGFGQTLAFHMSKAKPDKPEDHMQRIWQDVLCGALKGCGAIIGKPPDSQTDAGTVIKWLVGLESLDHRILLMEALEFASWMKRWAEILIEDDTSTAATAEVTADASNVAQ